MVSIEEWLFQELTKRNASITTAESCTGGLLSGRIVNVGGASEVFNQSFVTYSDDAKNRLLGVKQETLDRVGAVSEETAEEMAAGAAEAARPGGAQHNGNCGTWRRDKGKAGWSCVYRLLLFWQYRSRKTYFPR